MNPSSHPIRSFLSGALLLWLWSAVAARPAHAGTLTLDLGGQWSLRQAGQTEDIPATVPGDVHSALLAAGKIPDPFYRDNEEKIQWVSQAAWTFRRDFAVEGVLYKNSVVRLHCDGLDCLAAIRINGHDVGQTDNAFRTWDFDVKPFLNLGKNSIEITFGSWRPYTLQRETDAFPAHAMREKVGDFSAWIRKAPYGFGWDWGPKVITCGIWRKIELRVPQRGAIADLAIRQTHQGAGQPVKLGVDVSMEPLPGAAPEALKTAVSLKFQNQEVARGEADVQDGRAHVDLTVSDPKLWWPNGLGDHPLYQIEAEIRGAEGTVLDHSARRIGLRTVELFPPKDKEPLQLAVNGVRFFAKGASYIPSDMLPTRVSVEKLRRFVSDAVAVNMNTLRFWGGGYYEEDALFDACDEMGILVWKDFDFACNAYPVDDAFLASVRAEVIDNARRLRHHPSLGVWCGNNEVGYFVDDKKSWIRMSKEGYAKLFHEVIPEALRTVELDAPYTPGSPESGDEHYWGVWHGGAPFETYANVHGFVTEFGMQSFPEPRTVESFTAPEDRESVTTPVMSMRQKSKGGKEGNELILSYINQSFRPPKDFESTLWLSQIMQAYGIQIGAEGWRREMPRSMGCLYWQYNDAWPAISWSSVDYFGRWKALHYAARRFFAPVLVSGKADAETGKVEVTVCNDQRAKQAGLIYWQLTDTAGATLDRGALEFLLPPLTSAQQLTLDLKRWVDQRGAGNLLLWLRVTDSLGRPLSENLVTFVKPKNLNLSEPKLTVQTIGNGAGGGTKYLVDVRAEHPALWTWVTLDGVDARYSDNFIHLAAGQQEGIDVTLDKPLPLEEFNKRLRVRSLTDTAAPLPPPGAPAWGLGPFTRPETGNPILLSKPESVFTDPVTQKETHWESGAVFNPAAAVRDGKIHVLYRAEDGANRRRGDYTSRLGLATSEDGIHFARQPAPVFFPAPDAQQAAELPGGCEDPRLVETEDGGYALTYTQWDHHTAHLAVATSNDLVHWDKHGAAFAKAQDGKFVKGFWSKSGSIVTRRKGDHFVATRVNGKYWMYWGEGTVHLASSENLTDWEPALDDKGKPLEMLAPRPGAFDSGLVEPGPPAILTDKGILLLYNGKNAEDDRSDPRLPKAAYAAGQALFDPNDPKKILQRSESYFLRPEQPYERNGQYENGTVFIEGLAHFKGKYYLYYGGADSSVAAAVCEDAGQRGN